MRTDMRDKSFLKNPNAIYVKGMYGDPWMNEFLGVGPSPAPYKMKAMLIDGKVWVPDTSIFTDRMHHRTMKIADVQPPIDKIEYPTKSYTTLCPGCARFVEVVDRVFIFHVENYLLPGMCRYSEKGPASKDIDSICID